MDRIKKALELSEFRPAPHPEKRAAVRDLGSYPKPRLKQLQADTLRKNRVVSGMVNAPYSESYKLLRTRVIHRMRENKWKTFGITSPSPEVGKTLTAINLGIAIAMEPNHSVLLVDADLRRPNVHQVLGIEPEYGLVDYLRGESELDTIFINPGIEDFDIVPCRETTSGSSELLTSARMVNLVEELKWNFPSRLMMFDLPPILVADDVLAFSEHLDALLVVVEDEKTLTREMIEAMDIVGNTNILGIVLNKSQESIQHSYANYY